MRTRFVWIASATILALACLVIALSRLSFPVAEQQTGKSDTATAAAPVNPIEMSPAQLAASAHSQVPSAPTGSNTPSTSAANDAKQSRSPDSTIHTPLSGNSTAAQATIGQPGGADVDQHVDEMWANMRKQKIPPSTVVAHDELQSEQVDQAWAPAAIQQLESFLADQFGDRFDIRAIDCRTDMCEIRASGRSTDPGQNNRDSEDWQMQFAHLQKQPWWSTLQFSETYCMVTDTRNLPTFVCHLVRSR